jgi:hypothetical protein
MFSTPTIVMTQALPFDPAQQSCRVTASTAIATEQRFALLI